MNNEISFIVRTFFFFIFGLAINFDTILSADVILWGGVIVVLQYLVRLVVLLPTSRSGLITTVLTSPRGLITILLFYSIAQNPNEKVVSDIIFFVMATTIVVMTITVLVSKKKPSER